MAEKEQLSARSLTNTLNQNVAAMASTHDALQKALAAHLAQTDATVNAGRLTARASVMLETALTEAQAEIAQLQQEITRLQSVVDENAELRKQNVELTKRIAEMEAHPDVAAAKKKKAAEEKATAVQHLMAQAKSLGLEVIAAVSKKE